MKTKQTTWSSRDPGSAGLWAFAKLLGFKTLKGEAKKPVFLYVPAHGKAVYIFIELAPRRCIIGVNKIQMQTHMHMHTHRGTYMLAQAYTYIHTHTHTQAHIDIHAYACTHRHAQTYTHPTCTHRHTQTYTHTTCTHRRAHTHTHYSLMSSSIFFCKLPSYLLLSSLLLPLFPKQVQYPEEPERTVWWMKSVVPVPGR